MPASRFKILAPGEGRRFDVFGSQMIYKATAEDTDGRFSLAVETTAPHTGIPLHVHHGEDEAMYILQGDYEIGCGDEVARVGAGAFLLLPKDVPNRYENVGDTPGIFLYVTSPAGFERVVDATSRMIRGEATPESAQAAAQAQGVEFLAPPKGP